MKHLITSLLLAVLFTALTVSPACRRQNIPDNTTPPETDTGEYTPTPPEEPEPIVFLDLSQYRNTNARSSAELIALWETMHMTATLQGIVNREKPRLYIRYVENEGVDIDQWWWDRIVGSGKWLAGASVIEMSDPLVALEYFKDSIGGLVVYDMAVPSTSSVASMVAGAEDLIAVRYSAAAGSLYQKLIAAGYPAKVWLLNENGTSRFTSKTEPYRWAIDNYLKKGKCTGEYAAYYPDCFWLRHAGELPLNHHQLTNHDFFVSKRSFFFDLSPWSDESATDAPDESVGADREMLKEILSEIYSINGGRTFCHIGGFPCWAIKYTNYGKTGGLHGPVETEWEYARLISSYNAFKDADAISYGALANASFWQHFPLQEEYQQSWVTREELKQRGYLDQNGKVNRNLKYILFYVGDYDAAAWIYQMMPKLWEDPARGTVPLMWCINPTLARRAPMVMDYLRRSAYGADYFAAGDNGAGYLNPGELETPREISGLPSGVTAWAEHNKPFYKQWGLSVTGFIIDGYARQMSKNLLKAYASFSPNGIVPQKTSSSALLVDGMPVMRSGMEISGSPGEAAKLVLDNLWQHSSVPFYWFRTILQTPSWHASVKQQIESANPDAVWLDAPSYFELLRCLLEENAAQ